MIVAVQGTNDFDNYNVFIRAMGVALSSMGEKDREFVIYSVGPVKVNSFVSEFCNLSERGMRGRGRKIKSYRVTNSWLEQNMGRVNYFAFLSKPKQVNSKLVSVAELNNVEVGIFKY